MLKTAEIFQDGMILQRGKKISVWGQSDPETKVMVQIQGQKETGKADSAGNWQICIPELVTSECETMDITTEAESLSYKDVAIGEVWVAGGQSNMEFWMRYEAHRETARKELPDYRIRFFDVPEVCYEGQSEDFDYTRQGVWRKATAEDLDYFSAVGYYFQKSIEETQNVPVGIIGCNWGGTVSAAWMNPETVKKVGSAWMKLYEDQIKGLDMDEYWRKQHCNPMNNRGNMFADQFTEFVLPEVRTAEELHSFLGKIGDVGSFLDYLSVFMPQSIPGSLYEHMVKTIAPYGIRGFLWYQGESDDETPGMNVYYKDMLSGIISDWRTLWGDETLPFLIVQLPGFGTWMDNCRVNGYPVIRQCQQEVADTVNDAYLCSISDVGEEFDIHPKDKKTVGERLALLARKYVYEEDILADAPRMQSVVRRGNIVTITWKNAGEGITVNGDAVKGLHVYADKEEKGYTFETEIKRLILKLKVDGESRLRIAFARTPWYQVNLYNSSGIPAIPFEIEC